MPSLSEHPLRQRLNDELHARPPMILGQAEWVSYLAVLHEGATVSDEETHLRRLCADFGCEGITSSYSDHCVLEAGRLRVKWERHNEFSGYTFFMPREAADGPDTTALSALPEGWMAGLPGRVMVATHVELRSAGSAPQEELEAESARCGHFLVAALAADGAAWVASDFRLRDGWRRFLVLDEGMTRRQAGRTVQRVLEIETYSMMALLAFPTAKEVSALLSKAEQGLAELMEHMGASRTPEDERVLLADLTRLASEVERSVARSAFRFGAAEAYFALVRQRIGELRERRLPGFPTIQEFMDRRLAPAINTCLSVARRQDALSERVARQSALLRTRVDMELERQNQEVLLQMNQRARVQMRLQETVERFSVVVITYYASLLVYRLAEALYKTQHIGLLPEVVTAISIPIIGIAVAWGTHRMRKKLTKEAGAA